MADGDDLVRRFDAAMLNIYEQAGREVNYWATRYLQLVRRRGGLGAARYLLAQKATSDGYRHLRDADRLDLTVEALVLQPEHESLFSPEELARAREQLAQYRAMPTSQELEPTPELLVVVDKAAAASNEDRISWRDPIAAFGASAITAMRRWVEGGRSPGFAISVIEAVGKRGERDRAVTALRTIRTKVPTVANLADGAIARLAGAAKPR